MQRPTIYAPSTGQHAGAVAVIRLSGPASLDVTSEITRRDLPAPRLLLRRDIFTSDGETLDSAMVCVFPEGASYTGEAMAEIHCHGGTAVVSAVLDRLSEFDDCRMAEPGEFTLRAFESGRMDLTEVEGLIDLIAAETEEQRKQAIAVSQGAISRKVSEWREQLVEALALLEVTIDWADEDVPTNVYPDVKKILKAALASMNAESLLSRRAERLRNGFEIALVGAPNAGKSTLLNAIVGRDAAITSDIPGTTRDILEVPYNLDGIPVRFLDMAGQREASDALERMGVALARDRANQADLRLFLTAIDGSKLQDDTIALQDGDLAILTKADLDIQSGQHDCRAVSARTGEGMEGLLEAVKTALSGGTERMGLFAHHRQIAALEEAERSLLRILKLIDQAEVELLSDDLHFVVRKLEQILGRVDVDDLLDTVFSRFCLGK